MKKYFDIKISHEGIRQWVLDAKKLVIHDDNPIIRPEKIITDGLWQYPVAIKKEIGWSWREQKIRHEIHSGIGKNALVERVNKEVKRRFNWFGTFQAVEGANAFFGLFFYHFNKNYPNTG
jgi:transposase-like protein